MSTRQKYSGKGGTATQNEQTAQNPPQTVKNEDILAHEGTSTKATAETPTPPGLGSASSVPPVVRSGDDMFTFVDLLLFSDLCDTDKALLSGLKAKGFGNSQLVEAIRHMAATLPDSSPSDVFAGESLSDILGKSSVKKISPPKLASLSCDLSLLVNARFGTSRSDVLLFALGEYRSHRLKLAFNEAANGEYQNAYANFEDSEEAAFATLEIGLELGALADQNYWAALGEEPKTTDRNRDGFERFMRDYIGREATSLD